MSRRSTTASLALATALAVSGTVHASVFVASLDGLQEVPPNASPGTGFVQLVVDDTTLDFALVGNYSDLIGAVTAAHIHAAAPVGVNAGVIQPLTVGGGSITGNGTLTAQQFDDIQNGLAYVNVHTTVFPGGEIRGQLLIPEPGTYALITGLGLSALAGYRRLRRG